MRKEVFIAVILFSMLVFLATPTLWAQSSDIEIDGLIIDQTKSKMGHDFASNFSLSWETAATEYNIVIDEQSDFRAGSWVSIEINGNLVFKALLKPNAEEIENLAREAVADSNDFLARQNEAIRNLEQEKDMKGNGIH
ncbi:MAG: CsgE family curli-type amyloid fiber assembly protein [Desulfuromonadaceae bacterium]|nr:CsgE family curli-type amyloid fiber assembly protein [Desulfuromonadaceae bacterium]